MQTKFTSEMKSINKLYVQLHISIFNEAIDVTPSIVETFSKLILACMFLGSDKDGERIFYTQRKFTSEILD